MIRTALLAAAIATASTLAHAADETQVMIVGSFHMDNPGLDLHDMHADDMLAPKRQAEIKAVIDGIARFKPTMVAVEGSALKTAQRYNNFSKGTLPPSRNEIVQLGFRLARQADAPVYGIDVMGDFPYQDVEDYAKESGQKDMLDKANADTEAEVQKEGDILKNGTVANDLRYLNDPANIARGNNFYRMTLKIGGGVEQPGADLETAWYKRNFHICANLVQLAKPGDRIVVFYGAGHAFLLRQCVSEMPGYHLIEANDYLPK